MAGTQLVVTGVYGYDGAGRLKTLTYSQGGNTFASYGLNYDALNRLTSFTNGQHTSENATFSYDADSQLKGATRSGTSESYAYDVNGNRTSANGSTYGTPGTDNRLSTDGTYSYTYDAEGNITKRVTLVNGSPTGATSEYSYDYRNRLEKVTQRASPTGTITQVVAYTYDAFNRRLRRQVDTNGDGTFDQSEVNVFDGSQVALHFAGNTGGSLAASNLADRYLWGPVVDQLLADEQVSSLSSAGTVDWALTDQQNSIRDVAQYNASTGVTSVVGHTFFDSYGNAISQTGISVAFGYAGMWLDSVTGLYATQTRWYDPHTGRWMSEDPIGFAGGLENISDYVGNSPTNYTDPAGLKKVWNPVQGWIDVDDNNVMIPGLPNGEPIYRDIIIRNYAEMCFMLAPLEEMVGLPVSLKFSKHALERMAERGVTERAVIEAIAKGRIASETEFATVFELPSACARNGRGVVAVVSKTTGKIITVIDKGSKFK